MTEEERLKGLRSWAPFQPNEHFPPMPPLLRSSSVHMLIARMCIEAADLRIRLDGSRGLSPCQLIIAPRYRLHQKVTLVQAAFFRGKFNSGGRGDARCSSENQLYSEM